MSFWRQYVSYVSYVSKALLVRINLIHTTGIRVTGLVFLLALFAGCSEPVQEPSEVDYDPILIRVSGYGTYENQAQKNSPRQRLLAMRASKLDAYRALAERIYGTAIYGSSSVKEMVLQHDEYNTMVDSVIRGARVLSVAERKGEGFETVLEVLLSPRFRHCLTNVNYFRYSEECRMPLPHPSPELHTMVNPSRNETSGLYYLEGKPEPEAAE